MFGQYSPKGKPAPLRRDRPSDNLYAQSKGEVTMTPNEELADPVLSSSSDSANPFDEDNFYSLFGSRVVQEGLASPQKGREQGKDPKTAQAQAVPQASAQDDKMLPAPVALEPPKTAYPNLLVKNPAALPLVSAGEWQPVRSAQSGGVFILQRPPAKRPEHFTQGRGPAGNPATFSYASPRGGIPAPSATPGGSGIVQAPTAIGKKP